MTRRPTGSVDAALAAIQTWMKETKRVVDALRAEVELLRKERVELTAQLRFATDQANREVIAAATMKQELDSVRSLPPIPARDLEAFDEDTATDVAPMRAGPSLQRRVRGDATEKNVRAS
jgi:hypothetical protein